MGTAPNLTILPIGPTKIHNSGPAPHVAERTGDQLRTIMDRIAVEIDADKAELLEMVQQRRDLDDAIATKREEITRKAKTCETLMHSFATLDGIMRDVDEQAPMPRKRRKG